MISTGVVAGVNTLDFVGVLVVVLTIVSCPGVVVVDVGGIGITSVDVDGGVTGVDVPTTIYSDMEVVVVLVSTGIIGVVGVRGVITVVHEV